MAMSTAQLQIQSRAAAGGKIGQDREKIAMQRFDTLSTNGIKNFERHG